MAVRSNQQGDDFRMDQSKEITMSIDDLSEADQTYLTEHIDSAATEDSEQSDGIPELVSSPKENNQKDI